MHTLIDEAPEDIKRRFASSYFDMTQKTMQNFLSLCYDLSWYKNWDIEHRQDKT